MLNIQTATGDSQEIVDTIEDMFNYHKWDAEQELKGADNYGMILQTS